MAKTLLYDKKPRTLVGTGNPGSKHADVAIGTMFIDDAATDGNLIWVKTSPPGAAEWKLIVTTAGLPHSEAAFDPTTLAPLIASAISSGADPLGAAVSAMEAHLAAADPHGAKAYTDTKLSSLGGSYLPKWQANRSYISGDLVVNPTGQVVSAKANFTSTGSYSAADWTQLSSRGVGDYMVFAADYGFLPTATAAANETAFDAAQAVARSLGLPLYLGAGTFQKTNGFDLRSNTQTTCISLFGAGQGDTNIVVNTEASELCKVGGYNAFLSDFSVTRSIYTPTANTADGLVFYKASYGTFKRLRFVTARDLVKIYEGNANDPGSSTGTGNNMFSCSFEDISVNRYWNSGIRLHAPGSTGSSWTNIYVQNGDGTLGGRLTSTGNPLDFLGIDDMVFNQLNVEDHLGTGVGILLNGTSAVFNSIHFERVSLTGYHSQYLRAYGTSALTVNGLTLAFCDVGKDTNGGNEYSALITAVDSNVNARGIWIHDCTKSGSLAWRLVESSGASSVIVDTPLIKPGSPAFTTLTTSTYANGIKQIGDKLYSLGTASTLDSSALALASYTGTWRGVWAGGTAYVVGDVVSMESGVHRCVIAHTSNGAGFRYDRVRWSPIPLPGLHAATTVPVRHLDLTNAGSGVLTEAGIFQSRPKQFNYRAERVLWATQVVGDVAVTNGTVAAGTSPMGSVVVTCQASGTTTVTLPVRAAFDITGGHFRVPVKFSATDNRYLELQVSSDGSFTNYHAAGLMYGNVDGPVLNKTYTAFVPVPELAAVGTGATLTAITRARLVATNALGSWTMELGKVAWHPNAADKAKVVLWFDDGTWTNQQTAWQTMAKYGFSPTIASIGQNLVGSGTAITGDGARLMQDHYGAQIAVHAFGPDDHNLALQTGLPNFQQLLDYQHLGMALGLHGVEDIAFYNAGLPASVNAAEEVTLRKLFRSARGTNGRFPEVLPPANPMGTQATNGGTAAAMQAYVTRAIAYKGCAQFLWHSMDATALAEFTTFCAWLDANRATVDVVTAQRAFDPLCA